MLDTVTAEALDSVLVGLAPWHPLMVMVAVAESETGVPSVGVTVAVLATWGAAQHSMARHSRLMRSQNMQAQTMHCAGDAGPDLGYRHVQQATAFMCSCVAAAVLMSSPLLQHKRLGPVHAPSGA